MKTKRKFYIRKITSGCHSASIDCNNYKRFFERNDCEFTNKVKEASYVLLDACMSLPEIERDNYKELDRLVRDKRKEAVLIIGGCVTQDFRMAAQKKYNCPVVPFYDIKALEEILSFQKDSADLEPDGGIEIDLFHPYISHWKRLHQVLVFSSRIFTKLKFPGFRSLARFVNSTYAYSPRAYFLRCSYGCPHRCAYCTIVIARGAVQSQKVDELIQEARTALSKGYTHFVLVADDLPTFGIDQKENLPDLIKALFDLRSDITVELFNFNLMHALSYYDRFIDTIEPGRITCIHYCLQSGSEKILKLMNRRYTKDQFVQGALRILNKDPQISLKTDIIVGFPQETEEDFKETLSVIKDVPFDRMNISCFEDRNGVPASFLGGRHPEKLKEKRKKITRNVFYKSVLKRWLKEICFNKFNIPQVTYIPKDTKSMCDAGVYAGNIERR